MLNRDPPARLHPDRLRASGVAVVGVTSCTTRPAVAEASAAPNPSWRVRLRSRADAAPSLLLGGLIVCLLVVTATAQAIEVMPTTALAWTIVLLLAAAWMEAQRRFRRRSRRGDALIMGTTSCLRVWTRGGRRRGAIAWCELAEVALGETTVRRRQVSTSILVRGGSGLIDEWRVHLDGDDVEAGALVTRIIHSAAASWRAGLPAASVEPASLDAQVWALLEHCPCRVGTCPSCAYERAGLPPQARCPECGAPPPGLNGATEGDPILQSAAAPALWGSRRRGARGPLGILKALALGVGLFFGAVILAFGGCLLLVILAVVAVIVLTSRTPSAVRPTSRSWSVGRQGMVLETEPQRGIRLPWESVVRAAALSDAGARPRVRLAYSVPTSATNPHPRLAVAELVVTDEDAARRIRRAIELRVMGERISRDDRTGPPAEAPA